MTPRPREKIVFAPRSSPHQTVVGLGGSTVATFNTSTRENTTSDNIEAECSAGEWKSPEVRGTSNTNQSAELDDLF